MLKHRFLTACAVALCAVPVCALAQQDSPVEAATAQLPAAPDPQADAQSSSSAQQSATQQQSQQQLSQHDRAEQDIKKQEQQRVLGLLPQFNATDNQNAVPLSAGQKFKLAFRSAIDPATFVIAGLAAGISEAQDGYPGYGWGAQGYFKRWGASYADSFDSTMIGNAMLPALFHQDPRYFRLGKGKVMHRVWYAALTTVRCKGDNGKWQFNYSNVLGNFAAGGISNIYYPSSDRGAGLTIERASVVTAEGALGALFLEFWPDISRKIHHKKDVVPAAADETK